MRVTGCAVRDAGSEFRVAGPSIADFGSCPPVFRRLRILDCNLMAYGLLGTGWVLRGADING